MEFCEKGDLYSYIRKEYRNKNIDRLSIDLIETVFGQLLAACFYIHNQRIVHRDWKLSNIVVSKETPFIWIKLIDFGSARANNAVMMTRAGTPYTVDPHIVFGENYTDRSELFSLGCILFYLIYLRYPCSDCDDEEDIYDKVMNKEIEYPSFKDDEDYIPFINLIKELLVIDYIIEDYTVQKHSDVWNHFMSHEVVKRCLDKVSKLFQEHYPNGYPSEN